MNIVYYCFAGAHASVVASAIHCGMLPIDRIPTAQEFLSIPFYDRTPPQFIGKPYLMGCDEKKHQVYFMGMWNQREKITSTIQSLLDIAGCQQSSFILQDAFPLINFSTKCGGLLSKRYSFTRVGRSLTIWGMQRQYPEFVKLVHSVKNRLE
ncbi:DUF3189 family protein [Anaerospora hongkongensis]|uniref:DUF3189 family protein n=1 Tax=Anaerospora hongkongensis TaxID=244830 RepID=UPI0028A18D74|nr:DUF3189 family protein [Anaerospora hongkongensis]